MKNCGVILNYFGREDTIACIHSLLDQNFLQRVIVVENSCDCEELSSLKKAFGKTAGVEILMPESNLGFSGGVNFALEYLKPASYDAYLLLNNDTLIPPGTIKSLADSLESHDWDIVAPVIYKYPQKEDIWARGTYYNRFFGFITQRDISFVPGTFYYLSGCCLLIRERVFQVAGRFDASFFMYGEDVEFCFRAVGKGCRIGLADQARIFHKSNASSKFNSPFYEYHINRCHLLLCDRLSKTAVENIISLACKLPTLLLRAFFRSVKYGNMNSFSGLKRSMLDCLKSESFGLKKTRNQF